MRQLGLVGEDGSLARLGLGVALAALGGYLLVRFFMGPASGTAGGGPTGLPSLPAPAAASLVPAQLAARL